MDSSYEENKCLLLLGARLGLNLQNKLIEQPGSENNRPSVECSSCLLAYISKRPISQHFKGSGCGMAHSYVKITKAHVSFITERICKMWSGHTMHCRSLKLHNEQRFVITLNSSSVSRLVKAPTSYPDTDPGR